MMASVSKISIGYLVTLFIIYIVAHVGIGFWQRHMQKLDEQGKLRTKDQHTQYKIANFLMKWFPAIYVVVVLVIL